MSRSHAHVSSKFALSAAKFAALGMFCLTALGANLAAAQPHKAKLDPRAMQAQSGWVFSERACVPANGAQIWGGFAASNDLIDVRTGEICGQH